MDIVKKSLENTTYSPIHINKNLNIPIKSHQPNINYILQ